jgi:hypothetical protein
MKSCTHISDYIKNANSNKYTLTASTQPPTNDRLESIFTQILNLKRNENTLLLPPPPPPPPLPTEPTATCTTNPIKTDRAKTTQKNVGL